MLEAALVIAVLGGLVYLTVRLLERTQERPRQVTGPGVWQVTHQDVEGTTRVLVQKISESGRVLDEHLVATVRADDPAYDEKFLAAMAAARERRALFQAED